MLAPRALRISAPQQQRITRRCGAAAQPVVPARAVSRRSGRAGTVVAASWEAGAPGGAPASSGPPAVANPLEVLQALERLVRDAATSASAGGTGRWEEVERAWVLFPAAGTTPRGVVHFCGGAFAGASPQLTYRLLLETLSAKGDFVIVATPFVTSFDHLRVADEVQFTFDRAMRALTARLPPDLPVWGMGHSMGALAQCLISSRYAVTRAGNVLMSYNNKPATDAIPLFAPVVSPLMQGLSPLLSGYATSPLRGGVEALSSQLRGAAPPLLRELLPLLDQLQPLTLDVASGRTEFTPAPAETARLVRTYYAVDRTLLIRFRDDTIDETPTLAATLTESAVAAAAGGSCELTVTALPGDHVRPLQQLVPPPPPEVLGVAQQGAAALDQLSSFAGSFGAPTFALDALRAGVRAGVDTLGAAAPAPGQGPAADIAVMVDDIYAWMALRNSAKPPPAGGSAPGDSL